MNQRFLSMCGVVAPVLFVFMTILGGALRPGYSHIADTVSELFSPGSPNKRLLDTLYTIYALLLALFGIGVLQLVRGSKQSTHIGIIGAWMFIAMGLVSVATITVGVFILATRFFVANLGSPIMGLTERITIPVGFLWTFIVALWMSSRKGFARR